ncbi:unnamed protein product [Miscanthus lutarioriparius]|uniref:Peptidase A1 domain-containing protein n=1 Tax=Miscanthus lutarioriparius TaxID=422564 RepID=A0A811R976_9POAL|nr:unnamed protein product [Miscanthus lutarioriparius]
MTPSSAVASLFFFCLLLLLLPAQHGASSHASYKLGSRQVFFKTPGRSPQASAVPTATSCSSIATGTGNKKLPVVHRQSPCSPLHGLPSLTAADVLRRDTSRIRRRFASQSSGVAAPASAPPPAATIIPVNGSSDSSTLPGELDYSVLVGYGTPEQQFPMFLDTMIGTTLIQCKPCASVYNCDPAFDTSRSSTFTHVLCGSPDCPTNCSGGSVCPFDNPNIPIEGTFAQDVLKLTPSTAVDDFRFVCMDVGPPPDLPEWGFLSLGGNATIRDDDNRTAHAPLVSNGDPELAIMYFIDVVGMSLGGEDLPIPPGTFGSNASTNLNVGTTFTMLAQDVYTPLRDAFRKQMSQYNRSSPGFAGFDTCFNFTGLQEISIPLVRFEFGNGESLLIDGDQMLYYDDPTTGPFTMACLAFTAFDDGGDVISAVIGTYTLASTEVVYDVAGGKVGFIPWSC